MAWDKTHKKPFQKKKRQDIGDLSDETKGGLSAG